jgi:hypothetical protein
MNKSERYLIDTIKSYLNNTTPPKFDKDLVSAAFLLSKAHNVANMFYYGLPENKRKPAEKEHLKALMQATQQTEEYALIKDALNKNNIRFLGLKGVHLRDLYKNPDARQMADIDIFVDEENLVKIEEIMSGLGYKKSHTTDMHESYEKGITLAVEFHTKYISRETDFQHKIEDKFNPFEEGKKLDNSNEYRLDLEDEYIYLITHSARHFHGAGMGIKMVCDVYLFNLKNKDLDRQYINKKLANLHLDKFEKRLTHLAESWFGDSKEDDIDKTFGDWIIKSSAFGTKSQLKLHNVVSHDSDLKSAKKKKWIATIFPPVSYLSKKYLWLNKYKFLLPIAWIMRFFGLLFNGKKGYIKDRVENEFSVSEKSADELARLYQELGFYK